MTDRELVLDTMRKYGRTAAQAVQARADSLTGTELNGEANYIPDFAAACRKRNMLERPVGFVCRSAAGRVVKLLQGYDSAIYTGEPEELPAQWGFVWSTDPTHARPFLALSTSPYNRGDCCTHAGRIWRSGQDGNVWAPGTVGVQWDDLGEVSS